MAITRGWKQRAVSLQPMIITENPVPGAAVRVVGVHLAHHAHPEQDRVNTVNQPRHSTSRRT